MLNRASTELVKAGIIDPTKVVRSALQHAASVAGLLVTTEARVAERPKKESASWQATTGGPKPLRLRTSPAPRTAVLRGSARDLC